MDAVHQRVANLRLDRVAQVCPVLRESKRPAYLPLRGLDAPWVGAARTIRPTRTNHQRRHAKYEDDYAPPFELRTNDDWYSYCSSTSE